MIRQISSKSIYSVLKSCSAKCQSVLVAEKIGQSSSNEEKLHNAIKSSTLLDSFGRFHDYLRISLTDRCNLRCRYCMPDEGYEQYARPEILNKEEIWTLVKFFAKHGVSKVRLTGGEPTIRQDLKAIVGSISKIEGIEKLALTSNGLTLAKQLTDLKQLGLTHLNISLDTLIEPKFDFITRRKGWKRVWNTIELAETLFPIVKINCVVMRGFNDDEICDFAELTRNRNLDIRFIEYMPFGGNKWNSKKLVSYHEMKNTLENHYGPLKPLPIEANHTSKGYQVPGFQGAIGFISSMSNHFCGTCSRLRITADGCLKVCLHGSSEVSLKDALQSGASEETLRNLVTQAIKRKKKQHAARHSKARSIKSVTGHIKRAVQSSGILTKELFSQSSAVQLCTFTHVDQCGKASMVNVGHKEPTRRVAIAKASVKLNHTIIKSIKGNSMMKGDVLAISQVAGIMAAKRTASLIPLCHNIFLDCVKVTYELDEQNEMAIFKSEVHSHGKTGVEMEALTAVAVAALTLYDMCKAMSHNIEIINIHLIEKRGGKSDFSR